MRIAIAGSHRVGKSSLVDALAAELPGHVVVDEPYHQLAEEGHEFAEPPSIEEFELQLGRAIEDLRDSDADTLFDRCPLDLLAYLLAHEDAHRFDFDDWLPAIREVTELLDLVVYVPVEQPDRILLARDDHDELRQAVDEQLRSILLDDALHLELEVIEVTGTPRQRLDQLRPLIPPR